MKRIIIVTLQLGSSA